MRHRANILAILGLLLVGCEQTCDPGNGSHLTPDYPGLLELDGVPLASSIDVLQTHFVPTSSSCAPFITDLIEADSFDGSILITAFDADNHTPSPNLQPVDSDGSLEGAVLLSSGRTLTLHGLEWSVSHAEPMYPTIVFTLDNSSYSCEQDSCVSLEGSKVSYEMPHPALYACSAVSRRDADCF